MNSSYSVCSLNVAVSYNLVLDSNLFLGGGKNTYVSITMNMLNTCKYKSPKQILPLSFRQYIQLPCGKYSMVALDTFNAICPKCSQRKKPPLPHLSLSSVNSITLHLLIKARNLKESFAPSSFLYLCLIIKYYVVFYLEIHFKICPFSSISTILSHHLLLPWLL